MALESWGGLRLGLMALSYQQVIWTHLHCVDHPVSKPARWRSSSKASLSMRFPLLNDSANLYRLECATNYYYRSGRQSAPRRIPSTFTMVESYGAAYQSISPCAIRVPEVGLCPTAEQPWPGRRGTKIAKITAVRRLKLRMWNGALPPAALLRTAGRNPSGG
jgi:hypothetical protein